MNCKNLLCHGTAPPKGSRGLVVHLCSEKVLSYVCGLQLPAVLSSEGNILESWFSVRVWELAAKKDRAAGEVRSPQARRQAFEGMATG